MTKKYGFTLAEVLITLGVIGVVSALTIPSLVANTNSAKFKAQFKKDVSTLSQAARMAQADYGIDFAGLTYDWRTEPKTTDKLSDGIYTFPGLLNSTLTGVTLSTNPPSDSYPYVAYPGDGVMYATMPDGALLIFSRYLSSCGTPTKYGYVRFQCSAYLDVNGVAGPNKVIGWGGAPSSIPSGYIATYTQPVQNNDVTDIYPIVFHDGIVEAASPAGKYILTHN